MRSLAELRERVPNLTAVIIGEGYARPELEQLRAELGAESWLDLPGRVEDDELVEWYRRAWVVASTSLREGWGLVVSEAARFGVPSVVYPVPGLVDAVRDGETGIVSRSATPKSLAAGLIQILTDRALRARLGCAAAGYLESFSVERFIVRFEAVLQGDR